MPGAYAAIGAPIASKSAAEQVVSASVLQPGITDRERHRYAAENIAHLADSFLPGGRVDAEHYGGDVGRPTESYVLDEDTEIGGREIPAGSWIVSTKVTDDAVWRQVETGEITGMSVQGPVAAVYDSEGNELSKEEFAVQVGSDDAVDMATSRPPDAAASLGATTPDSAIEGAKSPGLAAQGVQWTIAPAPVGEVWDVELARADYVSLVGEPAVSEAQFVVAKSESASAGGGGPGTQSSTVDDIIMNDELEQRLDSIAESVDESAQAAKAAAESADEAQEAAAEAQAASEESGEGDGGSGGSEEYSAADLKSELEAEGVLGDSGASGEENGGPDGEGNGSEGAVNETLRTLVDAGVVNPEDLDDEDLDLDFDAEEVSELSPELEKRLATIEKAVQTPGRRGKASNLDALGGDEDGDGSVSGDRDFASALTAEGDD